MRSNNFYLALRERGKDVFTFPYFVDEVDLPPKPMTVTTGLTGYVLRTGRPLLVNRQTKIHKKGAGLAVLAEPTGETPYLEAGSPSAVWLGVPLTVRGETIGVMALQDYQDETAYGEEEKQILCFLGEQTALAIERKRAENDLLKALASEKELSQLKSTFVSTVSHEFRTPLGIILSSAQILADYFNQLEPAERNENLLSIQKNARRMADLMEEVLLLSQAEARKLDFKLAALDLASFCRRLTDEVLSSTNRRCPILLSLGLIAGEVQADERLLRHILTNLLTNAVKYSEPGSPVNFSLTRDGCDAVWQIRDHGIGISEADFERLCDPFHRGGNVGSVPGSGLGLTIVKRCVELHKGRIQFESQVGQGTRVTVRLTVFPEVDGSA
jgi:signal transduction histidine kinase